MLKPYSDYFVIKSEFYEWEVSKIFAKSRVTGKAEDAGLVRLARYLRAL